MARKRRKFTDEYKAEAVRLAREGAKVGKSAGVIAKELDPTETALRSWIMQADVDEGRGLRYEDGGSEGAAVCFLEARPH